MGGGEAGGPALELVRDVLSPLPPPAAAESGYRMQPAVQSSAEAASQVLNAQGKVASAPPSDSTNLQLGGPQP